MHVQQILAILVIIFFLIRVIKQKQSDYINSYEFYFWLIFWILSAIIILFLPSLDALVFNLGFSASGIEFLIYLAVAVLFYFIFRLRLRIARLEHDITKIIKEIAIKNH